MEIALWIVQGVLAAALLAAGGMKLLRRRQDLQPSLAWVEDFSDAQVNGIGKLEVAAALGLILPAVTGVVTILTRLAASGVVMLMLGAAATHVRRREPSAIVVNAVLLGLAAFVAWGRFGSWSL